MDPILDDDSPLARALLEGNGTGESFMDEEHDHHHNADCEHAEFAPTAENGLHARLIQKLGRPLRISVSSSGPVARIKNVCTDAISTRLLAKENEAFLEQFRYVIITSNLLGEQVGNGSRLGMFQPPRADLPTQSSDQIKWTFRGALGAVALPALFICAARWCLGASLWVNFFRTLFTCNILTLGIILLSTHLRRRRLHSLRSHALQSINALVVNLEAFDRSSAAAITMVQEVEAVSRGYHLTSGGLPPVSLFEDKPSSTQSRRLARLRRLTRHIYEQGIPIIIRSCQSLKDIVPLDDVEKYLEVYEVSEADAQEAFSGHVISEIDDQDSLRALRAMHLRFAILRRILLCNALSLDAEGSRRDILPWKMLVSTMDHVSQLGAEWTEKINGIITADDRRMSMPAVPSTPTHRSPEKEKYRQQLRRANEMAAELRTMQAKLFILRDDVTRILDGAGNVATIPTLFLSQSESLGHDLRTLQQTYETWKLSLSLASSNDSSRRISMASSGMRSPTPFGNLWSVDEIVSQSVGQPSDALRILNGGDESAEGSETSPRAGSSADEEVFEALALPRRRTNTMTREQKISWMQEEEMRRAHAREQRAVGGNMMRELESVMRERSEKRMSTGRIPVTSRVSSL